jgi:catalase (peroxidase I)
VQYTSKTPSGDRVYILKFDLVMRLDPEYKAISQQFVEDADTFYTHFVRAWVKVMEADLPVD